MYEEIKTGKLFNIIIGGPATLGYGASKGVLIKQVGSKSEKEMLTKTFEKNFKQII